MKISITKTRGEKNVIKVRAHFHQRRKRYLEGGREGGAGRKEIVRKKWLGKRKVRKEGSEGKRRTDNEGNRKEIE